MYIILVFIIIIKYFLKLKIKNCIIYCEYIFISLLKCVAKFYVILCIIIFFFFLFLKGSKILRNNAQLDNIIFQNIFVLIIILFDNQSCLPF